MNEIDGMRVIMPRINRSWVDQILVSDGQSTDGTQEYVREHGYDLAIQKEKGGRKAYNEAFPHVKGEIVITFSPNGKSVPERIPPLIEKISEGYDMVIVSRYKEPARSWDDTLWTKFGNRFFTTAINMLFGACYTDAMGIYRAYRTRLFWELDLDKEEAYAPAETLGRIIGGNAVSIEPLLSIRAAKRKLKVAEIPGDEPSRIGGVNKFPKISGGVTYLAQVIRELWHWK